MESLIVDTYPLAYVLLWKLQELFDLVFLYLEHMKTKVAMLSKVNEVIKQRQLNHPKRVGHIQCWFSVFTFEMEMHRYALSIYTFE